MSILLPEQVKYCLNTLENAGFECFCVGGAVRDSIMGLCPVDYDITTNALPENIIKLFEKTVPTGIAHGTVTVIIDNFSIEVTTYRFDGNYSDNRSPDKVTFVSSINDDLKRRDFTINSICYNQNRGFYDILGGINDINNKTIRAIGNPDTRFTEDALRIVRAFRFSAQLGFQIENNTKVSALNLSHLLKNISVERVFAELKKAFLSDYPQNFSPLMENGALSFLGFKSLPISALISEIDKDFAFRFAVFCYNTETNANEVLKALKSDNETIKRVNDFLYLLNSIIPQNKFEIKQILNKIDTDIVVRFLKYKNANIQLEKINEIIRKNEPFTLSGLEIDGNDLANLGFSGQDIGKKLNDLLLLCMEYPEYNNKEKLIDIVKNSGIK